jgi:hypothetical protein
MTDIAERLHVVRDHLRTGRFGQREVWEEWLTEAAEEIERLQALILDACAVFEHYDLPEHALHYRRALEPKP